MQIITPYHIYFNARLILQKWELWRLLTNFCYFGNLSALPQSCLHACQNIAESRVLLQA